MLYKTHFSGRMQGDMISKHSIILYSYGVSKYYYLMQVFQDVRIKLSTTIKYSQNFFITVDVTFRCENTSLITG